jgi:putative NIF3 family GTP cyclohydrolase 1 type 2
LKEKGRAVGLKAKVSVSRAALIRKLKMVLRGPVKTFDFGPTEPKRVGIITGAAGSVIYRVAGEKIDTFITGEAPHWAAVAAEELGMNLLLGGHYATETFGVKVLAAHLSQRFGLPWEFLNFPTGL